MDALLILVAIALSPDSLRKNPGVASVETVVQGDNLIIHILDYHIVGKEDLGKNLGIDGAKLDAEHAKVVKVASAVHKSKKHVLAGVEEVFIEALTDENRFIYDAEIQALADFHRELKRFDPNNGAGTRAILDEHHRTLLRLGAPSELLLEGSSLKVLAAEGKEYEAAQPKDGKIDEKLNHAREAALVRRIVKHGKTSILILGVDHDLSEHVKKHKGWGYVRVTPKGYPSE